MSAMEYVDVQERYSEKDTLPNNFGYFDLVNYCIHKDSPYTRNDFNSWKAMDAYKYFESGWIQSIGCKIIADGSIVIAEESISCTDILSKWLVPPSKTAEMAKIIDIKWSSDISLSPSSRNSYPAIVEPFHHSVMDSILKTIVEAGVLVPLMAVVEPFTERFVPKDSNSKILSLDGDDDETSLAVINLFLAYMFRPEYEKLSLVELQAIAGFNILQKKFRSTFKSVCRTSIITPAMSLIEKICYPESKIFSSKATEYGKVNESNAKEQYRVDMEREEHISFKMKDCGFCIYNNYPHCGVSPDGIIECECCGRGVLEIKCPITLKAGRMDKFLQKRNCPIVVDIKNRTYKLKCDHEYYFQVQMEIFICAVDYCDFVVWNPSYFIKIRIRRDEEFWSPNQLSGSGFNCSGHITTDQR
ncbi:hypothetical protein Bhyg_07592 [Pseudolycoriella hygida]|uniref:YqaJ viral recombinase domain-containing protein n=1 Tax=Pseudolycoriella hygida TaxID=35572 RepID=A0A9Q0N4S6_9DIPT|nr:hypothetical protein Bhyg_07592 [Pseudolycoriella hygida]